MAAVLVSLVLHLIQIDLIIRLELKAGLNNLFFFHFNHMENHMENLIPILIRLSIRFSIGIRLDMGMYG